jgi:hypothetical protein
MAAPLRHVVCCFVVLSTGVVSNLADRTELLLLDVRVVAEEHFDPRGSRA